LNASFCVDICSYLERNLEVGLLDYMEILFNDIRSWYFCFQRDYSILHFCQQYLRILADICNGISILLQLAYHYWLMILNIFSFAFSLSSFVSSVQILWPFLSFYWDARVLYGFWIQVSYHIMHCKYFIQWYFTFLHTVKEYKFLN
jgi:hypothetical protein